MPRWQSYVFGSLFLFNEAGQDGGGGSGSPQNADGNQQQAEDNGEGDGENKDELKPEKTGLDGLPKEWQDHVRKLRSENKNLRQTKTELGEKYSKVQGVLKDVGLIERDDESPEEKLKMFQAQNQGLTLKNAILQSALEHGVVGESLEYFEFLITKKMDSLEDDQEVTEDELAEIAQKALGTKGKSSTTGAGAGQKGGTPHESPDTGDISVKKFVSMSMAEKSALFAKNQPLYSRLMAEARENKLIKM